tara:strand:+ start:352 stop:558 length:207 start_codon:yes stop_codon:yes gene_type:complete
VANIAVTRTTYSIKYGNGFENALTVRKITINRNMNIIEYCNLYDLMLSVDCSCSPTKLVYALSSTSPT